ncbi:NAD(P)/FAD-dependent oxidoreductase [Sphaerisporangium corydalis]|uniref:NAD(P)/FAD-dependent oxidoreductase n=1 Tax=Sphaerisporangium corydalis TaxID=1441875 RepID=A0ABV9ECD4_9ACTN|nr:FAD-dependent oxidoreductase [Sphaerisporangium corydalis]
MNTIPARHRIVVIGAGYAGVMAAIRTARRTRRHGGRITLVNPSPAFTERLRMHELAAGRRLADLRVPDMVAGTGIEFVQAWVTAIDPALRRVTVRTGEGEHALDYDTLVYAIGSATGPGEVPGVADHAHTLDGPEAAARLAARLTGLSVRGGTVTVCGNGLTGIEAATEIAEAFPELRVVLIGREPAGRMMGERARAHLARALERLGIETRDGAEVIKVLPDAVELAGGETLHSDACLWTTGFTASPLAADSGITVDDRNRVVVDAALRSVSHPSIYAIGDGAAIPQPFGVLHGTCQSGIPSGAHAADSIGRALRGREPRPFRFGYFHQPVSLGRKDAVIQFTHADDTPRRALLTGRSAVVYKEFVSASPPVTYRISRRLAVPLAFLSPGSRPAPRPGS